MVMSHERGTAADLTAAGPMALSNRKAQTQNAALTTMIRLMPMMNQGSDAGGRHSAISSTTCPAAKRPKIVPVR